METIRRFKLPLIIVILHLIIVLYISSMLPDDIMVPRQWNFRGEVGSYSGKAFGLWFMWGMSAFLLIVFVFFPQLDPRYRKNRERFDKLLPSLTLLMTVFMMILHLYMLLWALEVPLVRNYNGVMLLVGLLFLLLGNILPKVPSNFYAGFRSPWTLSSDVVWKKTHRIGGYCFFFCGILMIIRGFLTQMNAILSTVHLILVLTICLIPYLYSYILYAREKKSPNGD